MFEAERCVECHEMRKRLGALQALLEQLRSVAKAANAVAGSAEMQNVDACRKQMGPAQRAYSEHRTSAHVELSAVQMADAVLAQVLRVPARAYVGEALPCAHNGCALEIHLCANSNINNGYNSNGCRGNGVSTHGFVNAHGPFGFSAGTGGSGGYVHSKANAGGFANGNGGGFVNRGGALASQSASGFVNPNGGFVNANVGGFVNGNGGGGGLPNPNGHEAYTTHAFGAVKGDEAYTLTLWCWIAEIKSNQIKPIQTKQTKY
mmetsp:Transcript_30068/g.68926  ORF Transcript_30068/g.68926 Transcript_30068/m.68926 type:complete len:262 (+) Transcript_30068:921-1706(+)